MDTTTVSLRVYSPRWGKEDNYDFRFSRDELVVSSPARKAVCTWREGRDPLWSDENLMTVFQADSVYPPAVLPKLLEHVWREWRGGSLDAERLEAELGHLVDWLNTITRAKPNSEFWSRHF